MIKINTASEAQRTSRLAKKKGASAAFKPDAPATPQSAQETAATAPAAMLGALIDLQSNEGGEAKTFAAAQRTLELLDELRMHLLDGAASPNALEALSEAAAIRPHAAANAQLHEIYDQIALRARVELAKLGR